MACPPNQIQANPPLYGLGIRLSIYHLWLGTLLIAYLTPSSVPNLRLLSSFFTLAIFFALILQSSWGTNISALDAYITLLLCSGAFFTLIPIYIWRVLSMCNPFWDTTRWPVVPSTRVYKNVEMLVILSVASYTIWFWGTGVHDLPPPKPTTTNSNSSNGNGEEECQDWQGYGFFFASVPLDAGLFIAVNIVFAVALMIGSLISLGVDIGWIGLPRWRRKQERRFEREMDRFEMRGEEFPWKRPLQLLQALSNTIVLTIVIIAVELTIQRNNLSEDVNDLSTSGQLIPLFVVAGYLLHGLYVYFNPDHDRDVQRFLHAHSHSKHHHHHKRKGSGGGGGGGKKRSRSSSDKGGPGLGPYGPRPGTGPGPGGGGRGSVYVGVGVGVVPPGRPYHPGGGGPPPGGGGGGGPAPNVVSVEPGPQGV